MNNGGIVLMAICARRSRPGRCSLWCRTCVRCAAWTRSPAPAWRRLSATRRALRQRPTSWPISAWCHPNIPPARSAASAPSPRAGDVHARTLLIEAAHSYRFPARIARHKLAAVDAVPEAVREIAWKAQTRLCQRYRHMMAKGKPKQVVVTAIARELAGFVWSIACITSDPPEELCQQRRRRTEGSSN